MADTDETDFCNKIQLEPYFADGKLILFFLVTCENHSSVSASTLPSLSVGFLKTD